jgi:hypothetical protein
MWENEIAPATTASPATNTPDKIKNARSIRFDITGHPARPCLNAL